MNVAFLQRIVELQESWRIMVEFNTHGGPGQQYQDHKARSCSQCLAAKLLASKTMPRVQANMLAVLACAAGDLRDLETAHAQRLGAHPVVVAAAQLAKPGVAAQPPPALP